MKCYIMIKSMIQNHRILYYINNNMYLNFLMRYFELDITKIDNSETLQIYV